MTSILIYKEKVKSVIEAHGGEVSIDIIPGIIKQPRELQPIYNPDYFQPVELEFNGEKLTVNTTGYYCSFDKAKEFQKRLQVAIDIIDETLHETVYQHIINPSLEQLQQKNVHAVHVGDVYCNLCGAKIEVMPVG